MSGTHTSRETLEVALATVEDSVTREELRQNFYLVNPIDFARLIDARGLSIPVKAKLLALKVAMPPTFKGIDLDPLVQHAMDAAWGRITEQCK